MRSDDFYLAWLAREARFTCVIRFAPERPLGYRPLRHVVVSIRPEPELQAWLKTKGIENRFVGNAIGIRKILHLLAPVSDFVKDRKGMEKITKMVTKPLRGLGHEELFHLFSTFHYYS